MSEVLQIPVAVGEETVAAIVAAMEEKGLVVPKEGRQEPYEVKEICEVSGLGRSTVERIIKAGTLRKIEGSARLLVAAKSVKEWLEGGSER